MFDEPMKRVNVMLSAEDRRLARRLGGGSISAGLRIALKQLAAKVKR
jgi:hypothetical protein